MVKRAQVKGNSSMATPKGYDKTLDVLVKGGDFTKFKGIDAKKNTTQTGKRMMAFLKPANATIQAKIITNPLSMPLPLGRTPNDFKASQIPNTAPKYTKNISTKANTAYDKIQFKSKSMIFRGGPGPSTRKGIA